MAGSQKRVMRKDSDEETYAPAPIRRTTTTNSSVSLLDNITDENARDEIERKIKDVVRLAVFTSHSDSSLKREDIKRGNGTASRTLIKMSWMETEEALTAKSLSFPLFFHHLVVGDITPKMFDAIFQKAQERLRDVFGMELVELTIKGRSGNNAEKGMFNGSLFNLDRCLTLP